MMDEVARALGQIEGRLGGIEKEIGEVKTLIKCQSDDCKKCRSGLEAQIEAESIRIDELSDTHVAEKAVTSWVDSRLGQLSIIVGISAGIVALALSLAEAL